MDLTPDQITALILTAFEKGIARGRELAAAEASAGPQVFVRPGRFVYASPNAGPCAHIRTTRATWPDPQNTAKVVNGPTQCNDCGQVVAEGDTL